MSMMEPFCENSQQFLAVNYFHIKAPSWILHKIITTPLGLVASVG